MERQAFETLGVNLLSREGNSQTGPLVTERKLGPVFKAVTVVC